MIKITYKSTSSKTVTLPSGVLISEAKSSALEIDFGISLWAVCACLVLQTTW